MSPATLEAARRVLPLWVTWLPVAIPFLAFAAAWVLTSLAAAIAGRGLRRLAPGAHWTERARLLFPVRKTLLATGLLCMIFAAVLPVGGPVSVGRGLAGPLSVLAAISATLLTSFRTEDRWARRIAAGVRLRSVAALVLAMLAGYLAPLAVVIVDPDLLDRLGAPAWLALLALLAAAFTFGGGLLLARALGLLGPAPERQHAALARALPAGAARPRLWRLAMLSGNAVALPWLGAVIFTDGALERLDDEQLAAVMAHELEHLREPLPVRALRIALAALLPVLVPAGISLRREPVGGLIALLAFFLVLLAFRPVQRAMERRSDAAGHAASPAYAAALEALYEWNLVPAVLRTKRAHPDLVDRLTAAGAPPAWPRPAPPPRAIAPMVPAAIVLVILAVGLIDVRGYEHYYDGEAAALRAVALRGSGPELGSLALVRYSEGRMAAALPLLRAARELDPQEVIWPASEATAFAKRGRCEEARASLEIARGLDASTTKAVGDAADEVSRCVAR